MVKFGRLKIWLLANLWIVFLVISVASAALGTPTQNPWPTHGG